VAGEPGIGKSRLIWALQQHVAQSPDAFLMHMSCSPYYVNTAFYPVVQHWSVYSSSGRTTTSSTSTSWTAFSHSTVSTSRPWGPCWPGLLAVKFERRYPPLDLPADRQRQLTIDALITITLMRADYQPLLVVVEDLQWIDPSSLDLLTQLIEHVPRTRQLVVLSFRPEFKPPWPEGPGLERLNLNRLDREASRGS
jgi:predicted ATPase